MKHINANISNLTSLWTTVSKPFDGCADDDTISYSQINNSEWPNKVWLNKTLTNNTTLKHTKELIKKSKNTLRLVDFEFNGNSNTELIESSGYKLTSSLPGMSIKLTKPFNSKTKLSFKLVTNAADAKVWCAIFEQSFGYVISEDLVIKNLHKINFYIAFNSDIPVGTIKSYQTNTVIGIYSLGVPIHMRGNGYAKEIMYFILNKAIEQQATLAILQASKLAEGMYERLGFKKDFTINFYKLKTL
jgi:Acetyltransferase (GNAT) family.